MADLRRALGRAASAKMLEGDDLTPNRGRVATRSCRCAREGSASAAATCGVTGTRRRNRWRSRHRIMVHAPVSGRACAHTRGGQPCSTGRGAAGGRMRLRNNVSPS